LKLEPAPRLSPFLSLFSLVLTLRLAWFGLLASALLLLQLVLPALKCQQEQPLLIQLLLPHLKEQLALPP
jgi:hypothetical protein